MTRDDLRRQALTCLLPSFLGLEAPGWVLDLCREGLGGVVVFGGNVGSPGQLSELCAHLGTARPDLVLAIDEEGGDVTRLHTATGAWAPGNRALGAVDDLSVTRAVATEMARELRACGLTMTLAPSADVAVDERNPVVGVRSFGADPALVARHVAAFVAAVQDEGIAACVKHFPGHGGTGGDSHRVLPTVDATEETLRRRDLVPFQAAVDSGARAVMSAHVRVPALDGSQPATHSAPILTRLLREVMRFDGAVVSDALDMAGASADIGVAASAVRALSAGVDALCLGRQPDRTDVLAIRDGIVEAVEREELAADRLRSAAARVTALGAWTAQQRRTPAPAPLPHVGLAAARRAVQVRGDIRLAGPPLVLELRPEPTIPAGPAHWGLADALVAVLPGTRVELLEGAPPGAVGTILAPHARRPVVVVMRDSARHEWEIDVLEEALEARPDSVVVELGIPGELPPAAGLVLTHGASLSSSLAVAEALTGVAAAAPPAFVPPSARTAARVEAR